MISALFVLASAASAIPQSSSTQPYLMEKASSIMVDYAVKYRQSGVPEAEASSAAAEVVRSILAPSQATDLVRSAASYYAVNGPQITGAQAEQLVSKASSYYNEVNTKPAYTGFTQLVQKKQPLFNVQRAVSDAQSKAMSVGNNHNEKANKLIAKAGNAYQELKADPAGAKAIQDGKQLAKRVAGDFNINTSAIKVKAIDIRDKFINMLYSR